MGVSGRLLQDVRSIYGDKVSEKYDLTLSHAEKYIEEFFSDKTNFDIVISANQIAEVIVHYFVDIHRFKERREMVDADDFISAAKIAAFTAKWLIKFKPLTVEIKKQSRAIQTQQTLYFSTYINELFVVEHIQALIGTSVPKKLYLELIHEFRSKKLSETQLYMTLEQLTGFYNR